jgi:hypothetical protein
MGHLFVLRLRRLSTCLAAFCVVASAGVIVDVSSETPCCGPFVYSGSALQIYWIQSREFDDVSISIPLLLASNNAAFDITAYLTTTAGPGTSPPPVASASLSGVASTTTIEVLLFSGLTLDPGTYYLTVSGPQPNPLVSPVWIGVVPLDPTLAITTAPGVTISNAFGSDGGDLDASYPPASTFFLNGNLIDSGISYEDITVTGTPVPEPPTWWLTVGAAVILVWSEKSRASCTSTREVGSPMIATRGEWT